MVTFYPSKPGHSGWGSVNRFGDVMATEIQVPAITLDSFIETQNIEHVDLVKIDVEAHEFEVIEGARNSLARQRIRAIFIEYNGARLRALGYSFRDFLLLFSGFGYCPTDANLALVRNILDGSLPENEVCTNFLFQPEAVDARV